jgi:hypothetical protein
MVLYRFLHCELRIKRRLEALSDIHLSKPGIGM